MLETEELIQIQIMFTSTQMISFKSMDLNFTGSRLDDVYMEAITVNLNNVAFPSTADVILKSRDGTLHFDTYSSPQL